MGDLDGTEQAFIAAHQAAWDPQPGLAMTYLARGDVARCRFHPGRSRTPLEDSFQGTAAEHRASLLEAQVEIAAAAGYLDRVDFARNDALSAVMSLAW
ncbi:MAG: hypothetical protein LAT50_06680 [Ectothiorhodospiraceae bacterium]|nr:hypothetical protein [Ectothiorhodospiraceae bacterium]